MLTESGKELRVIVHVTEIVRGLNESTCVLICIFPIKILDIVEDKFTTKGACTRFYDVYGLWKDAFGYEYFVSLAIVKCDRHRNTLSSSSAFVEK